MDGLEDVSVGIKLNIEYLSIDALTPYRNNARKHEKADLKTIENSIREFGMCDPIGIWGEKNIIVEGHGRLLALKELGYTEVPCIRLDHLSDEQRRAYALAHNKTAEMSEWDFGLLDVEIDNIADIDMSDFGFDIAEELFDESNLDDETTKENVVVSINIPNIDDYNSVKEKLQNIADSVNATLSVKMQ